MAPCKWSIFLIKIDTDFILSIVTRMYSTPTYCYSAAMAFHSLDQFGLITTRVKYVHTVIHATDALKIFKCVKVDRREKCFVNIHHSFPVVGKGYGRNGVTVGLSNSLIIVPFKRFPYLNTFSCFYVGCNTNGINNQTISL